MFDERRVLLWGMISTALILCATTVLVLPGTARAALIQEYTFEVAGGYTTEHPDGVSFSEFSGTDEGATANDDVFGRDEQSDSDWDAAWGSRNGTFFFGWRDPEGQDPSTSDPFIFISNEIDISAYVSVTVHIYWRAEGAFEASDLLSVYLIEDSVAQAPFWTATELELESSVDYALESTTVDDTVDTIQIVIEGLNNAGTEYMAVDDVAVYGALATAVEMTSFTAEADFDSIRLDWETASEVDHAGFHVWRYLSENDDYVRITDDMIESKGGATWGAAYSYEDIDVEPGKTYFYQLEDIDYSGTSAFHGPVFATVHTFCGATAAAGAGFLGITLGAVLILPGVFFYGVWRKLRKP